MNDFLIREDIGGGIVTMLPTLCVPEKLNREALIKQVNYLQESIIEQGDQLHEARCLAGKVAKNAEAMANDLWKLADAWDAGNQAEILLLARKVSDRRKALTGRHS